MSGLLLLAACQGYQTEPYAEVQLRDEHFADPNNTYEGETFMVGVRYVPPMRLQESQLTRLEHAMRPQTVGGQPIVIDHKDDSGDLKDLVEAGSNVSTWAAVGGLLAIALIIFVWRRKSSPASPSAAS